MPDDGKVKPDLPLSFRTDPFIVDVELDRFVAQLVAHLVTLLDPVAKIDVRQTIVFSAADMIEDHIGAEAALLRLRLEIGIDHRQAVAHHVGEGHRHQLAAAIVGEGGIGSPLAIFHDAGVDLAVLDHHRIVEDAHLHHAAGGVTGIEIAAEQRILLARGFGAAQFTDKVRIRLENAPLRSPFSFS